LPWQKVKRVPRRLAHHDHAAFPLLLLVVV
jgi:hypothetical protein